MFRCGARNLGRLHQAFACATVTVVQCMVAATGDSELEGCVAMSSLGSHKSVHTVQTVLFTTMHVLVHNVHVDLYVVASMVH